MPDCEEQKFFAAGEQVGKPLPSPSCTTEPLRVPDELRRPPETPIPEPVTSAPPVIVLHNRQVTLTCQDVHPQETIYGDAVTVAQGAYSSTYTLAALKGISKETLEYIVSEGLLDWIEEYLNTKAFGSMSVKQVAKKLRLTNKQATQLINEAIVIIDRLNDLALTNAGTQISCYWLNEPQTENCPDGSVEGDNGLNPASVVAAGVVTSYLSQADADARAKTMAREALVCHWVNDEQSASCAVDMNMPGFIPNELHAVYPGLEPRQGTVYIASGSFTYAAKTPSEDVATPEELQQFGEEAIEEANRLAKDYALSLLVCYYVNPAMETACDDVTAGTVIKHTYDLTQEEMESDSIMGLNKDAGTKTRYELIHRDASFIGGTRVKGQRVFVPEGYIVSTVSQEEATARAEVILTSLLECCFINRAFEATCPPAQVLDSSGNPKKDAFGNDVYVEAEDIPGSKLTVEAGTFYSCTSQADVDAMAESSIEGMLVCTYCSEVIPPTCVPVWVDAAATSGIVLSKDMEVWEKDVHGEWVKVEMHAGDTYKVALPLDIYHLTNPYTGEDEDITLWAEDATIGAPARYNCSADVNVSNQLAELYAVTKANDGDAGCTYQNKKVIVTCSGNDPFTQCPACKPSFPHDIETLPETAEEYHASSADSVWPFMGWAEGIDRVTGEPFVFGSARGNFPWDDVESFPNCATYLVVNEGLYISKVSVEEATLLAQVFATSLMSCVNTNPEIHLYCDMPGKPTVAIGTTWHPTPTGYLSTACKSRAGWPHTECTCAAVLLDYGHDEDDGVYAVYAGGYVTVIGQQDSPCSLPAVSQTLGTLYADDCGNNSPMYRQYGQDGETIEYGDFTVNGNYPQRIYMEPPVEVNYATLAVLDPTLRNSGMTDAQKDAIAQTVMRKKMAEISSQDGLKKIVPWWAFAKDLGTNKISMYKDGILPSYIGPAPPYYGATPDIGFAPGSNVMRISEMPGNGKSWAEVVTENNPVIIAARTIRKKNSTNYACWKEARDLGLSMLYCQYCASGPIIIPTPPDYLVPCCDDPEALNYCVQKTRKTTKRSCSESSDTRASVTKGGEKKSSWGADVIYTEYSPDCMFLGDTPEEALEKRRCFVASVTRVSRTDELSKVECWYGNDEQQIAKPCEQVKYRNKAANNYMYWDTNYYVVSANTVLSNRSKSQANLLATQMLNSMPAPVCIAQNDALAYTPPCDTACTSVFSAGTIAIPEGMLTSMEDTTASLNSQVKAMMAATMSGSCLAMSKEFYMSCPENIFSGGQETIVKIPKGLIVKKCDTAAGQTSAALTIEAYEMASMMLQCPVCNIEKKIECTTEVIEYKGSTLYIPDFKEQNPKNIVTYQKGIIPMCTFMCPGKYELKQPDNNSEEEGDGSGGDSESGSGSGGSGGGQANPSTTTYSRDFGSRNEFDGSKSNSSTMDYSNDTDTANNVYNELHDWITDNFRPPDSIGEGEEESSTITCTQEYLNKLAEALGASLAVCMVENSTVTYKCKKPSKGSSVTVAEASIVLDAHEYTKQDATDKAREIAKGATTCLLGNARVASSGCKSCEEEEASNGMKVTFIEVNKPVIPKWTLVEMVPSVEEGNEGSVDITNTYYNPLMKLCKELVMSLQVCIADKFELKGDSTREIQLDLPTYEMSTETIEIPNITTTTRKTSTKILVPVTDLIQSSTILESAYVEIPIMVSSVKANTQNFWVYKYNPQSTTVKIKLPGSTGNDSSKYYQSTQKFFYEMNETATSITAVTSVETYPSVTSTERVKVNVRIPLYTASTSTITKYINISTETVQVVTSTIQVQHLVESTMSTMVTVTGLPEYAELKTCTPKYVESSNS